MRSIALALALIVFTASVSNAAPKAPINLPDWAAELVSHVAFIKSYFASTFDSEIRSTENGRQLVAKKQNLAPQPQSYRQSVAAKATGELIQDARERAQMSTKTSQVQQVQR